MGRSIQRTSINYDIIMYCNTIIILDCELDVFINMRGWPKLSC